MQKVAKVDVLTFLDSQDDLQALVQDFDAGYASKVRGCSRTFLAVGVSEDL